MTRVLSLSAAALAATLALTACNKDGGADTSDGGVDPGSDSGRRTNTDGGAGGPDGGGGGDVGPSAAPVLDTATARAIGPLGQDLEISVAGSDLQLDVQRVRIRVLDQLGAPVLVFDSDWDGLPDSAESESWLDGDFNRTSHAFAGKAVWEGLAHPDLEISSLQVAVLDAAGNSSGELDSTITAQPVKMLNELCDPNFEDNRCEPGMGCYGSPATCHEGTAPDMSRLAYLRSADGAQLLAAGTDPDNDLSTLHLEFLDEAGNPVTVDLDNDETPESTTFDYSVTEQDQGAEFFVSMLASEQFSAVVPQLAATPVDRSGRQGLRQTTLLADPEIRNRSQSCDPLGFDRCATGLVCTPGTPGVTNTCQDPGASRTTQCRSAPRLDPATSATTMSGVAEGASLWDAPAGCSANDPTGRPEGIALLHLRREAAVLRITTDLQGTDFDTTVYVIAGCTSSPAPALACNDDGPTSAASSVELTQVPAGDYLIVVDSFNAAGGHYTLSVSVE